MRIGKHKITEVVEQSLYEVRKNIYARSVKGLFSSWRIIFIFLTQILYYGLPWINWNGRQAVLFDLIQRKFYIFGLVLWPQDVIYLTALLILSAFSLFLFTTIAGRLFCGYVCPQTVYSQMFMWIEHWIEGDRFARIRLDEQKWPWNIKKWRTKLSKHSLWLVISFLTGFTFIGFFTPIRELSKHFLELTLGPWQLFWFLFYSFATWGNAGFMREQVCKYMCPYARFQSVMVDQDTFVVTYDKLLGEPRGARNKASDQLQLGLGNCVNCSICVQVCPTGIDIRNGLQYMCIGCGACIDACNQVMEKINYPQGLIRYTSERAMLNRESSNLILRNLTRPRVLIYSLLIVLCSTIFIKTLATRNPIRVDVMRDRGLLGRVVQGGQIIENVYRIQIMNVSERTMAVSLQAVGIDNLKVLDSTGNEFNNLVIKPVSNLLIPIKITLVNTNQAADIYPIHIQVVGTYLENSGTDQRAFIDEKSSFIIPKF
jgi:cytochrome c oxidase accessory protein FixG